MPNLNALGKQLCSSALGRFGSARYFEENCIELKETLVKLARLGRYNDISSVMKEFDDRLKYHNLTEDQVVFLLGLMPISLDSALNTLMSGSEDVATMLARNLVEYNCFSGEETTYSDVVTGFLKQGYTSQACHLMSAYMAADIDNATTVMEQVMGVIYHAIDEGDDDVIVWAREHEHLIKQAFLNDHKKFHMRTGIDLYEKGLEDLGATVMRSDPYISDLDLLEREELIGVSPRPSACTPSDQRAYILYMLAKEELSPEWSDIRLDINKLGSHSDEKLSSCIDYLNRNSRVAVRSSVDRVCAALIKNAKCPNDFSDIKLIVNGARADLSSKIIAEAVSEASKSILNYDDKSRATPYVLEFDKMFNSYGSVDYGDNASVFAEQINAVIPELGVITIATYLDQLMHFPINKDLITSHINSLIKDMSLTTLTVYFKYDDHYPLDPKIVSERIANEWSTADLKTRDELLSKTPRHIALICKPMKVQILENEIGI